MASTLTDAGELTYVSFGIEKIESTPDGDLMCYGRASDGSLDHDLQIVDPQFSSKAIRDWLATGGNVRVQHNPQRDPAGVGLEVNTDDSGATWVKSLIIEPVAKKLLAAGALRAYSVGIARPTIVRDAVAKGGRITDGSICEISLVDRPSNARCGVTLVKSADDGTPEYIGKVFGADDAIAKALGEPETVKGGDGTSADELVSVDLPATMSLSVSPADLARMNTLSRKNAVRSHYDDPAAQAAEKRDFDRGVGGGVDRDKLPDSDFAGPHRSFPIVNQSDVSDALGLAGHADDPDAVRARIRAIARRKGLSVPDESDSSSKGAEEVTEPVAEKADAPEAAGAATPDVTKEPGDADAKDKPVKKAKKKPKGPKKMPPWLNKPSGDDDDGKDGGSGSSCKSAADHLWAGVVGSSDIVCSKCHTTPAQAAGVTASPMDPAPVGELMESTAPMSAKGATPQSASGASDAPAMRPVPAHREPDGGEIEAFEQDAGMSDGDAEGATRLEAPTMKNASSEVLALLRFKSVGIDPELGTLHDLTCPAYHPDEVAKYHPFADLGSLIDEAHWQRKALAAACGPLEHAIAMQELTAFALALKAADPADVNDWRLEAHKAFRDANPGPGTYPTPGSVSPRGFNRPLITDGRSASSAGHSGPTTSPVVATGPPNAMSFDRPPLSAGQESPSPSFMKWDQGQYPDHQGMPVQLNYAHLEKERQRVALARMHEHLSRQFPAVCPLDSVDLTGNASRPLRGIQPEGHPVPATAGIGKGAHLDAGVAAMREAAVTGSAVPFATGTGIALPPATKSAPPAAASFKAEPEAGADRFADADVYKGFKRQRKKLGKKVLAGKMTVDEARAKMGRQFAQKAAEPAAAIPATYVPADPGMTPAAIRALQDGLNKMAGDAGWHQKLIVLPPGARPGQDAPAAASLDPDLIKAAVREALHAETVPLEASATGTFDMGPSIESAVTKAVAPLLEKIRQQDETYTLKLAETQRVIDAIADQPDPSTASFSGLAFQPARKTARPAGVTDIAEAAARARRATERELENLYESASDPFAREGFYSALNKVRGGAPNS